MFQLDERFWGRRLRMVEPVKGPRCENRLLRENVSGAVNRLLCCPFDRGFAIGLALKYPNEWWFGHFGLPVARRVVLRRLAASMDSSSC